MFTPLHSSTNQELFKKYICNQSSQYAKYNGAARPSYRLNWSIQFPSLSAMFNSLHIKLSEKYLGNQGSCYEKYEWFAQDDFRYTKETIMSNHQSNAIHCQQRWTEHKGGLW